MKRFIVGPAGEIPPGTVRLVRPEGDKAGIGVFNVDGEFYALRNHCPHMGAPLCRGSIKGTAHALTRPSGGFDVEWAREGEIIACPWHHWEFEIRSGRTVFPSKKRARRYDVAVEEPDDAVAARLRKGVETIPVIVEEAVVVLLLDS